MRLKTKYILRPAMTALAIVFLATGFAFAAPTPDLSQTINSGALATDILDNGGSPVATPSFAMPAQSFSFACQTSATSSFGTDSQRLYVANPGAANDGWTLTVAATDGVSAAWENSGSTESFDFNDPSGSGCNAGQMTVNATPGTLAADCTTCTTTNITKGSSAAFNQGTIDSITLLNASASSDDVWRGYLTGVNVSQTIPAETTPDAYSISLTLTATAS